jgi:hypothetical protein
MLIMKLYELCPQIEKNESYIYFDKKYLSDIFDFFLMDIGTNIVKKEIPALAQSGLTDNLLSNQDALDAIINVPIFSENFVKKVGTIMSKDITFYPCLINSKYRYYLGKIKTKCQLIDYNISEYWDISDDDDRDAEPILSSPVYLSNTSESFYIARDIKEDTEFLVSELFKDLIIKYKFNIKIREVS